MLAMADSHWGAGNIQGPYAVLYTSWASWAGRFVRESSAQVINQIKKLARLQHGADAVSVRLAGGATRNVALEGASHTCPALL